MVKRDEKKINTYVNEMVSKIEKCQLWFLGDLLPYLDYCKQKVEDFPEDVNYREAVNIVSARYVY